MSRDISDIDNSQFYNKFKRLPEKTGSIIRIIDKTDFYSLFDEDAYYVAETIYKTSSALKESKGHKYITLSHQAFSQLLRDCLIDKGMKVEIYDKELRLTKSASPGNLEQVEDLLNMTLDVSPVVVALKIANKADGKNVGLCFIDTSVKEIGISQIVDNDLFSNLEAFLIQLGVKEVVLGGKYDDKTDPDTVKLVQTIEKCNIVISWVKSSEFNIKDIEQDLSRLLENELALGTISTVESNLSLSSANALLGYLGLLSDNSNFGTYKLKTHTLSNFMKLDSSALRALNLFPSARDSNTKNSSIYSLLNKCKTNAGSRLLGQWIKQPLTGVEEITQRHKLVEILINNQELRLVLQSEFLATIPDIKKLTRKLSKRTANLEDIVTIYQLTLKLPSLIESLESVCQEVGLEEKELIEKAWLDEITEYTKILSLYQGLVETTIDLDSIDQHKFIIKPAFSDDLIHLKDQLDELDRTIRNIHQDSADELNVDVDKKLKLENHPIHGWCMRLTRNDASVLRDHSKTYQELQTVKAGVFFTTRELSSCSKEVAELEGKYNSTQSELVKDIVETAATHTPVLEKLSLVLSYIDVMVAFAHVSCFAPVPYVKPLMHPMGAVDGRVILKEARHPCLESQDDINFIANDVVLKRDESSFLIITGPNMGGKSTYIKQVGVIALLAQIGCFVPCDEAELTVFDAILSRVGAGDSQLKGLSTFMSEMLETSSILKSATENSLIIIDELGRGTSTYDGFGLAWAISEHLITKIKAFSLFATHFHELTELSAIYPNSVENLHVVAHINDEADEKTDDTEITLLYKVEPGISSKSFGIHVAELVKFPVKIVNMAKRKAAELEAEDSKDDPYIKDKRTKCSPQEVSDGIITLKELLKEWRSQVDLHSMKSDEIVDKLKLLIDGDYKGKIANDKFVQEIMTLL